MDVGDTRPPNRDWPAIPEVEMPRGGYSSTGGGIYASGGWCAPSETVYDFFDPNRPAPKAYCPDWNGPEQDACEATNYEQDIYGDYYEDGTFWRSWHSCKDEYRGPHAVCVCEDCGATRVIVTESKGASWSESSNELT